MSGRRLRRRAWLVTVVGLAFAFAILAVAVTRLATDDAPTAHELRQTDDEESAATASCPPAPPIEVRGAAALALVDYPIASLAYSFQFLPARRGYLAITNTATKTIALYVRPCQAVDELAHILGHEVGHAVDDRFNSEADRALIAVYRGYAPRPWFGCSGCTDYATPAGDFAETFAFMHSPPGRWRSLLNGPPGNEAQLAAMEQFYRPGTGP